jgi:hypothetical protein
MSTPTFTGSVPLNLLTQGDDARVSAPRGERDPIWFVPRGDEITVSFVSAHDDFTGTGWYTYREAQASGILLPGSWADGPYAGTPRGELPYALREIPVEDIELVEVNGETKYRYRRPYLEVSPGNLMNVVDDIIDARSQRFTDDNGRTKVEWTTLVNVVVWDWPDKLKKDGKKAAKPEHGAHILLKLSKNQAALIVERLAEKIEEEASEGKVLDIKAYKWKVTIIGGKPNKLVLKRGEKITEPLEFEAYDASAVMARRKERFEDHVRAAFGDYLGTTAPPPDFAVDESTTEHEKDEVADAEATDLFSLLSTAAIRTRLKKAGVTIPAGSSREKLIELAVEAELA